VSILFFSLRQSIVVPTEEPVKMRKSEQEELSPSLRSKEETFFDLIVVVVVHAIMLQVGREMNECQRAHLLHTV